MTCCCGLVGFGIRVAAQDTTDPETGKRFFQPETIKRSEHLRLALCLIDSYECEHTAP
jgi:hypothetical protein